MKLLLDSCAFLWITDEHERLSPDVREAFEDPANDVYLSAASIWEMSIKYGLGRLPLPEAPGRFFPTAREAHGIRTLAVDEVAAAHTSLLPPIHRDPFDRILVAQAIVEGMVLATPDRQIQGYPCLTLW